MTPTSRVHFLLDNGSLEPAATLQLRRLAEALERRTGERVEPVSLLHSSGVPAEKLDGRRAEIFEPALRSRLAAGATDFTVLPLFIAPSRAITEYLPQRVEHLRERHSGLQVRVRAPLFQEGDDRLARILEEHVRGCLTEEFLAGEPVRVALVDHGSPARDVTEVRDRLAGELAARLGRAVAEVAACSMERRPGDAYAFNEPLLETLLTRPPWNRGPVVVAMLFLLPGRHAGPVGDVAKICEKAARSHHGLRTVMTPLLAEHPLLVDILADRLVAE